MYVCVCVCLSRVFWVYCSEYLQLNEDLQGNPLFDDKTMVESRICKNHWHINSEVGVKHEIPKNRWWISSNIYRPLMNLNLTVTKCDKVGLTFTVFECSDCCPKPGWTTCQLNQTPVVVGYLHDLVDWIMLNPHLLGCLPMQPPASTGEPPAWQFTGKPFRTQGETLRSHIHNWGSANLSVRWLLQAMVCCYPLERKNSLIQGGAPQL